MWTKIIKNLSRIYTPKQAESVVHQLKPIIKDFHQKLTPAKKSSLKNKHHLSASDIMFFSYASSITDSSKNVPCLKSLRCFLSDYKVNNVVSLIHLLPFYPWDTDRCFSVTNYYKVDPDYGDWHDIRRLSDTATLMFDLVLNHTSISNPIAQSSLISRHLTKDHPRYQEFAPYQDFIIAYDKDKAPSVKDLKQLARPRAPPVLTNYHVFETQKGELKAVMGKPPKLPNPKNCKIRGEGLVWTTFSYPKNPDGTEATRQVDLNFKNPNLFVELIKILLFYIDKGATFIRLDAVGYIWKKIGSSSLHEKEAHLLLQIICDISRLTAPGVITIAEVNEPQEKAFEYLGDKHNREADLVYQFTPFPLSVYAILTGDTQPYKNWVKSVTPREGRQLTLVFGSHDGMGLKPIRGFLTKKQTEQMLDILITKHQALPNYASLPGGKKTVYEICATPWNLINPPDSAVPFKTSLNRYLAVLVLGLMTRSIPGIYINGLVGAPNYCPRQGLDENRTINRQIFNEKWLCRQLDNPNSSMGKTFKAVIKLLKIRSQEATFNPNYPPVELLEADNKAVVSVLLKGKNSKECLIGIVNVSPAKQKINTDIGGINTTKKNWRDIISGVSYTANDPKTLTLELTPYQILWLKP